MIQQLDAAQAEAVLPDLIALLQDAVASGASVGFVDPLTSAVAASYWQEVLIAMRKASRLLLVAQHDGQVAGTVQLDLVSKPNALHRAEVQKLLVLQQARRHGLGRQLMLALEPLARQHGRSLLVLDTREGDHAEELYRSLGYTAIGAIPAYARNPDGTFAGATFFYRLLSPPAEPA